MNFLLMLSLEDMYRDYDVFSVANRATLVSFVELDTTVIK